MARTAFFKKIKKLLKIAQYYKHNMSEKATVFEKINPSRRRFLKTSLISTGLLTTGYPLLGYNKPFTTEEPVLIIGAGAAGLAAAYTLYKQHIPFLLVEASQRIGGRIYTHYHFNDDGQFMERGGELVDTDHEVTFQFAQELGLTLEAFADEDVDLEGDLFYFNGTLYTEKDFIEASGPLLERIAQASDEIYGDSDEYILYSTVDVLPNAPKYDEIPLDQFLQSISTDVEPWVRQAIEVAYIGEYGLESSQQSAINLIDLIDLDTSDGFSMFGESDEAYRIQGGNSVLINKLVETIKTKNNIRLGYELIQIEKQRKQIACTFETAEGKKTIKTKQVICAIPFTILRQVAGIEALGLTDVKLKCIQELGYGTNSKVMLSFDERFWRQSYQNIPANAGGFYGDFASQNFWETSRLQQGDKGIITAYLGGNQGFNANQASIQMALKDFSMLYPQTQEAFLPYRGDQRIAVNNWAKASFAQGSYSCHLPGQYTTIWGAAGETELNNQLFFAGEHTNLDYWGYMNGAYESGVIAAHALLKSRNIMI